MTRWFGRKKLHLIILVASLYVLVNDNIYPDMQWIDRSSPPSPYGVLFTEKMKEKAKNLVAEKILLPRPRTRPTEEYRKYAAIAWKYFADNINNQTGLVNTVSGYQVSSAWDIASSLSALHSARKLQVINKTRFDYKLQRLLQTLNSLELVNDQVPNKYYNTTTAKMVGYTNKEGKVGFSSLDLGRLLQWLYIIKHNYPEFASEIDRVVLRWNFCNIIDGGELFGGKVNRGGELIISQQGRLGYEEYAAKGFYLWGFNTSQASRYEPFEYVEVASKKIPVDQRDLVNPLEKNFVVADSYLLDGIEYGWDNPDDFYSSPTVYSDTFSHSTASAIYHAQRIRFEATGIPTARGEIQLPVSPYFVYDAIYANGKPWNTIDDLGRNLKNYAAMSTKSAFAMWALWDTPYTDLLISRAVNLNDPGKGYYEGMFESGKIINSHTANTNAAVLASLAYVSFGKAHLQTNRTGLWEFGLNNALKKKENANCYPLEYVCTTNCDQIAGISTSGIKARQLREIEEKLQKLESSREELLKPFEIVQ